MNQRNPTMKLIASAVVFTFFVTSLGITPDTFAATSLPLEMPGFPAGTLAIPAELGQVTDAVTGDPKAPSFIHIQSAHGNYQAEKNIEKLLSYIEKNSSVKLMLLEGAADKLQPELFRIFPGHPDFNRKVTDKLMQEGYLTGPERFLIENTGERGTGNGERNNAERNVNRSPLAAQRAEAPAMQAFGVEDLSAYKKDREAFISVVKKEKTAEKFLGSLRAAIDRRFSSKLNKDLLNLVRQEEAFGSGTVSFEGWLKTLGEGSRKHLKLDLSDAFYQGQYPFLIRYFRLQAIGSKIDQDKAIREAELFLNELKGRKISHEIIQSFKEVLIGERGTGNEIKPGNVERGTQASDVTRSPLAVPRGASGYSSMRHAFDMAFTKLPADFSMNKWPTWTLYAQYVILMQELEAKGLHDETGKLKDRIFEALAQTPAEKEYLSHARKLYLLRRLFSLELTRNEYEELLSRGTGNVERGTNSKFSMSSPNALIGDPGLDSRLRGNDVKTVYSKAMLFYAVAVDREKAMFQNALKKMADEKQPRAVIVTGGFHAEGLKKHAKDKNCSYIQITPRIAEVSKRDHEVYLKSILGSNDRSVEKGTDSHLMSVPFSRGLSSVSREASASEMSALLGLVGRAERTAVTGAAETNAWVSSVRDLVTSMINSENVSDRPAFSASLASSVFGSQAPTLAPVMARAEVREDQSASAQSSQSVNEVPGTVQKTTSRLTKFVLILAYAITAIVSKVLGPIVLGSLLLGQVLAFVIGASWGDIVLTKAVQYWGISLGVWLGAFILNGIFWFALDNAEKGASLKQRTATEKGTDSRSEIRLTPAPAEGEAPRPDMVGRAQEKQFQKDPTGDLGMKAVAKARSVGFKLRSSLRESVVKLSLVVALAGLAGCVTYHPVSTDELFEDVFFLSHSTEVQEQRLQRAKGLLSKNKHSIEAISILKKIIRNTYVFNGMEKGDRYPGRYPARPDEEALKILAKIGYVDDEVVGFYRKGLQMLSASERRAALQHLGDLGKAKEKLLPELVHLLLDPEMGVRQETLKALRGFDNVRRADFFATAILSEYHAGRLTESDLVRYLKLEALGDDVSLVFMRLGVLSRKTTQELSSLRYASPSAAVRGRAEKIIRAKTTLPAWSGENIFEVMVPFLKKEMEVDSEILMKKKQAEDKIAAAELWNAEPFRTETERAKLLYDLKGGPAGELAGYLPLTLSQRLALWENGLKRMGTIIQDRDILLKVYVLGFDLPRVNSWAWNQRAISFKIATDFGGRATPTLLECLHNDSWKIHDGAVMALGIIHASDWRGTQDVPRNVIKSIAFASSSPLKEYINSDDPGYAQEYKEDQAVRVSIVAALANIGPAIPEADGIKESVLLGIRNWQPLPLGYNSGLGHKVPFAASELEVLGVAAASKQNLLTHLKAAFAATGNKKYSDLLIRSKAMGDSPPKWGGNDRTGERNELRTRSEARGIQTTDYRPQTIAKASGPQSSVSGLRPKDVRSEVRGNAAGKMILAVAVMGVLAVGCSQQKNERVSVPPAAAVKIDKQAEINKRLAATRSEQDLLGIANELVQIPEPWATERLQHIFSKIPGVTTPPEQMSLLKVLGRIPQRWAIARLQEIYRESFQHEDLQFRDYHRNFVLEILASRPTKDLQDQSEFFYRIAATKPSRSDLTESPDRRLATHVLVMTDDERATSLIFEEIDEAIAMSFDYLSDQLVDDLRHLGPKAGARLFDLHIRMIQSGNDYLVESRLRNILVENLKDDEATRSGLKKILTFARNDSQCFRIWHRWLRQMDAKDFRRVYGLLENDYEKGFSAVLYFQGKTHAEGSDAGLQAAAQEGRLAKENHEAINQPEVLAFIRHIETASEQKFLEGLSALLGPEAVLLRSPSSSAKGTWAYQSYVEVVTYLRLAEVAVHSDRLKKIIAAGEILLPSDVHAELEWSHQPSVPVELPKVFYQGRLLNGPVSDDRNKDFWKKLFRLKLSANGMSPDAIAASPLKEKILSDNNLKTQLIRELQDNDPQKEVQWRAMELLVMMGKRAVPALIEATKSQNHQMRANAVKVLGQIKDVRAIPALIEALQSADDFLGLVKLSAAEALGSMPDASAVPALIGALKDQGDDLLRSHAAQALGTIKDARAVPALIEALNDRTSFVRIHAAQALGKIGDPRASDALRQILENRNPDLQLVEAASEALKKIGSKVRSPRSELRAPSVLPRHVWGAEDPVGTVIQSGQGIRFNTIYGDEGTDYTVWFLLTKRPEGYFLTMRTSFDSTKRDNLALERPLVNVTTDAGAIAIMERIEAAAQKHWIHGEEQQDGMFKSFEDELDAVLNEREPDRSKRGSQSSTVDPARKNVMSGLFSTGILNVYNHRAPSGARGDHTIKTLAELRTDHPEAWLNLRMYLGGKSQRDWGQHYTGIYISPLVSSQDLASALRDMTAWKAGTSAVLPAASPLNPRTVDLITREELAQRQGRSEVRLMEAFSGVAENEGNIVPPTGRGNRTGERFALRVLVSAGWAMAAATMFAPEISAQVPPIPFSENKKTATNARPISERSDEELMASARETKLGAYETNPWNGSGYIQSGVINELLRRKSPAVRKFLRKELAVLAINSPLLASNHPPFVLHSEPFLILQALGAEALDALKEAIADPKIDVDRQKWCLALVGRLVYTHPKLDAYLDQISGKYSAWGQTELHRGLITGFWTVDAKELIRTMNSSRPHELREAIASFLESDKTYTWDEYFSLARTADKKLYAVLFNGLWMNRYQMFRPAPTEEQVMGALGNARALERMAGYYALINYSSKGGLGAATTDHDYLDTAAKYRQVVMYLLRDIKAGFFKDQPNFYRYMFAHLMESPFANSQISSDEKELMVREAFELFKGEWMTEWAFKAFLSSKTPLAIRRLTDLGFYRSREYRGDIFPEPGDGVDYKLLGYFLKSVSANDGLVKGFVFKLAEGLFSKNAGEIKRMESSDYFGGLLHALRVLGYSETKVYVSVLEKKRALDPSASNGWDQHAIEEAFGGLGDLGFRSKDQLSMMIALAESPLLKELWRDDLARDNAWKVARAVDTREAYLMVLNGLSDARGRMGRVGEVLEKLLSGQGKLSAEAMTAEMTLFESKTPPESWRRFVGLVTKMEKSGTANLMPTLAGAMTDPYGPMRLIALEILSKLEPSDMQRRLVVAAARDDDVLVRRLAVKILQKSGDRAALPALIKDLEDYDYQVKSGALASLRSIMRATAEPAVLNSLARPESWVCFVNVVTALEQDGVSNRIVPPMIAAWKDGNQELSRFASEALAKRGAAVIPELIKTLSSSDASVRQNAQSVLRSIGVSYPSLISLEVKAWYGRLSFMNRVMLLGMGALLIVGLGWGIGRKVKRSREHADSFGPSHRSEVRGSTVGKIFLAVAVMGVLAVGCSRRDSKSASNERQAKQAEFSNTVHETLSSDGHVVLVNKAGEVSTKISAQQIREAIDSATMEQERLYSVLDAAPFLLLEEAGSDALDLLAEASNKATAEMFKDSTPYGPGYRAANRQKWCLFLIGRLLHKDPRVAAFLGSNNGYSVWGKIELRNGILSGLEDYIPQADEIPGRIKDLKSDKVWLRIAAAGVLGNSKDKTAVLALSEALKDSDALVRAFAAEALGKIGDKAAIPALVYALQDKDEGLREDWQHKHVSFYAARALGKIGDQAAVPELIYALRRPPFPFFIYTKIEIIAALGEIGDPVAAPVLVEQFGKIDYEGQKHGAAILNALVKFGQPAVPFVIDALKNGDDRTREFAARALGIIGNKAAVPALIEALKDKEYRVGQAAAIALVQLADKRAVPYLIAVLKDDNPHNYLQELAASALGDLEDRTAVPVLVEILRVAIKDKSAWSPLGIAIVEALGKIGDSAAEPVLMEMKALGESDYFYKGSPTDKEKIVRALAKVRKSAAAEPARAPHSSIKKPDARPQTRNELRTRSEVRLTAQERAIVDENLPVITDWLAAREEYVPDQAARKSWKPIALEALRLDPSQKNLAMVFGSYDEKVPVEAARIVQDLKKRGIPVTVLTTGRYGNKALRRYNAEDKRLSEGEYYAQAMEKLGVRVRFMERRSKNTGQNIRNSKSIMDHAKYSPATILVIQNPLLQRRAGLSVVSQYSGSKEAFDASGIRLISYAPYKLVISKLSNVKAVQALDYALQEIDHLRVYPGKNWTIPTSLPAQVLSAESVLVPLLQRISSRSEARLPAEEKQFQRAMSDLQPKWWDGRFNESDVPRKLAAIKTLGELKDPRVVSLLSIALQDSDKNVRLASVNALVKIQDPRVIPTLGVVLQDENVGVRFAAVGALRELKAIPELVKALNDDQRSVRTAAAAALRDLAALAELGKQLNNQYPDVRIAAATVLGQLKDANAVPALMDALKDRLISDTVATALEKINDPRSATALSDYKKTLAREAIAREEAARLEREREEAARLARESESSSSRDDVDYNPPQVSVGRYVGFSFIPFSLLALAGQENGLTHLFEKVGPPIVGLVIALLILSPIIRRLPKLFARNLNRPNFASGASDDLNIAAYNAGLMKDAAFVPDLIKLLKNESDQVRQTAAWALAQIQDNSAVPELGVLLETDPIDQVKINAAMALDVMFDARSVPSLVRGMSDKNPLVRQAASAALGSIAKGRGTLRQRIDKTADYARTGSSTDEGKSPLIVPAFVKGSTDSDAGVRINSVLGLWMTMDPAGLPALEAATSDVDPKIVEDARKAIAQIKQFNNRSEARQKTGIDVADLFANGPVTGSAAEVAQKLTAHAIGQTAGRDGRVDVTDLFKGGPVNGTASEVLAKLAGHAIHEAARRNASPRDQKGRSETRIYETPVIPKVPAADTSSLGAKLGTAVKVAYSTVSLDLLGSPVYASEIEPKLFAGTIHFQKAAVVPPIFAAKWPVLNKIISRFATASTERLVIDQRQGIPDAASVLPLATFALYNPKVSVVLALVVPSPGLSRGERDGVRWFVKELAALSSDGVLPVNFKVQAFANENEFVGAFAGFYNSAAPLGKSVALITDREDSVVTQKIGSRKKLLSVVGGKDPLKQTASTLLAADKLLNESIWSMGYHFVSVDKLGGLEALMAELTSYIATRAKVLASA